MYSNIKTFSTISIVLSVICAVCSLLNYMSIVPLNMDSNFMASLLVFSVVTPVLLLLLSLALRSFQAIASTQSEAQLEEITALKKRIEQLEKSK